MFKYIRIGTLVVVGFGIVVITGLPLSGAARADTTMPEAGAYEALSARNKKVAEALFNGQIVTPDGNAPLSLDLIAASKQRSGWGRIFRQLRRDGLIDAKNLKELLGSGYQSQTVRRRPRTGGKRQPTVVTTAAGRQIIVDKNSLGPRTKRNIGRRPERRGGRSIGSHSDGLLSNGSTYRGRLEYTGKSRNASSLGIVTGKGAGTANFIANTPKEDRKRE